MTDVPGLAVSLRRRGVCSLAWTEGNRVVGIGAARARSGGRTWEVSHLFLASDDGPSCLNLLGILAKTVARRGGERVFIRISREDPLVDVARRSGFSVCGHELLYKGRRRQTPPRPSIDVRVKTKADDFGIFRLYTSCTPSETRLTSGMTFDQWSASRERAGGRAWEFVVERDGVLAGWLKTVRRFRAGMTLMMLEPDDGSLADGLMDHALQRLSGRSDIFCLVQEHQAALQRAMWRRGFEVDGEYVTLAKSMVVAVRQEERKEAVTIAPT